jgi:hypothetical protein
LEPRQPSSPERDAISYQELDSDVTEPSLARILELHRYTPWIGDTLPADQTSRVLRAYSSMAIAMAVRERLDAEELVNLLALALANQQDDHPQVGIDVAADLIIRALERR